MIKLIYQNCEQEIIPNYYPAGEPLMAFPPRSLRLLDGIKVQTTKISELIEALFYVDALRYHGFKDPLFLTLPYVPGGRQDRLNTEGDYLFTLKSVAFEINRRDFSDVYVLDPHSDVTPALIENCRLLPMLSPTQLDFLTKEGYDGVIVPDAGAGKRASIVAKYLQVPTFQAWKKRDVATGKLSGFGIEQLPISVRKFLVVDDICDGGRTFIGLAELPALSVRRLDLYVSHGLFTQGTKDLLDKYGMIYTTDSVLPESDDPDLKIFYRF